MSKNTAPGCYVCSSGRRCAEHKNYVPNPVPPVLPFWVLLSVGKPQK